MSTPITQYAYRHAGRVTALFVAWFVPTTSLNLAITWFGFKRLPERIETFGIVEGNPYTDLPSVTAFVTPEVLALGIGIVAVYLGGWLKGRRLATLGRTPDALRRLGFHTFCKQYFRPGWFAYFLILIPIVVAVGSVVPVINNLMWLAIGWGPTKLFGPFIAFVATMLAIFPSFYMIRRWAL